MSKKTRKPDTNQLSLLDLLQRAQELQAVSSDQGSMNVEARMRQALSDALKHTTLSVHQVAGEMSHLLGETITADMIYTWTAESKTKHQIWAGRLPAFCRVTGDRRPLEILAEATGLFTLPGPEALRAEIQRYAEEERRARAEKRKREMFLQEIEKEER
jgi:hypothetical protein